MYDIEESENYLNIIDNLFGYQKAHQHIHLMEKEPGLLYINLTILFVCKKLLTIEKVRIKY